MRERDPFVFQHYVGCFLMRILIIPNTWACIAVALLWEIFETFIRSLVSLMLANNAVLSNIPDNFIAKFQGWMYESE